MNVVEHVIVFPLLKLLPTVLELCTFNPLRVEKGRLRNPLSIHTVDHVVM